MLELKGGYFGLKSLCRGLTNTHIKMLLDNTSAVHIINNMGSCKSISCDKVARNIWEWARVRNIWITSSHIPGVLNVEADIESRRNEIRMEWKLIESEFDNIQIRTDFQPDIDLFASRINKQLKQFVAYRPDPDAKHINAFTINWHLLQFYAFPPFAIIGKVLQKIIQDEATGILVVPDWPGQVWYPLFHSLIVNSKLYHIPSRKRLLYLPNQPQMIHPIWDRVSLLVGIVSGNR